MKTKRLITRILLGLCGFFAVIIIFTVIVNYKVERDTAPQIYDCVDSVPRNRVGLLLGTSPINRYGGPNSYFTNRINTAAELYHAGKIDFIIASGDNHIREYDEPTAMRDSLMAHGVPADRIILDFAGFRTLDSVVRAKEIFGCDSLTIISQADHNARALYLAKSNGIEAVAVSAPLRAGRLVKTRLAIREWLARDKMMLDIIFGKQPHFLGEKIEIPDLRSQHSYSTSDGLKMEIVGLLPPVVPIDSITVRFSNTRAEECMTGEWFKLETLTGDSAWQEVPWDKHLTNNDGSINVIFNAIGYSIAPGTTRDIIVKPWFYEKNLPSGKYRLLKTYHIRPWSKNGSDTAYVEFSVR